MKKQWFSAVCFAITILWSAAAQAQSGIFGDGWTLDDKASSLQFQSIKNGSKIETSTFASITGDIGPDGTARLKILLDSVDTKVDLRNVRMRFLFFETFQYPEVGVTTRIDPALVADLPQTRRKTIALPFTIDMHGISRELQAQVSLTLIGDDLVAVSTAEPITLSVADFNLMGGLKKLEEAANVTIVPSSSVNFDFIFRKRGQGEPAETLAAAQPENPASAALETQGDFTREACVGRFEILSRTGNIYFRPGSALLDGASAPLLNQVADIVARCPGLIIQVSGHTDSIGSRSANQHLSEKRAASVVTFLESKGIARTRMKSAGFGEDRPVADNATAEGRGRNRRIEFSVAGS